jgi:hypothetical protein
MQPFLLLAALTAALYPVPQVPADDDRTAPTIPVYFGTAVVTEVDCLDSEDSVGSLYEIAYRDSSAAIDFGLIFPTGALGFVSTSATQGALLRIGADGNSISPASYSDFSFSALSATEARMMITLTEGDCTESYRALLTLTSVTP